jgi:hypothetical protein
LCESQSQNSASPADAWYAAVEPLALLPDGRSGRRTTPSGCRKSRPSDFYRSLHRRHAVASRRGYDGRHNRRYCRRRYRRYSGRVADAAGIVDRAVQSARVRGPRRNAADAGILGRQSAGGGQKTHDRNGQKRHSSCHPFACRNKLHAPHGSVIPYPAFPFLYPGRTGKDEPKFQGARTTSSMRPHTLHRIALLWSNRAGVWRGTSST